MEVEVSPDGKWRPGGEEAMWHDIHEDPSTFAHRQPAIKPEPGAANSGRESVSWEMPVWAAGEVLRTCASVVLRSSCALKFGIWRAVLGRSVWIKHEGEVVSGLGGFGPAWLGVLSHTCRLLMSEIYHLQSYLIGDLILSLTMHLCLRLLLLLHKIHKISFSSFELKNLLL